MIKKENKQIHITLDPEYLSLLNSLANRFHISKTELIKQALKIFGASKKHHYHTYLNNKPEEDNRTPEQKEENWNKVMDDLESWGNNNDK